MSKWDAESHFSERGVQSIDTPLFDLDRLSWDDLNAFIAVAESGSFRAASIRLGRSINTVRAVLERLEQSIGCEIALRSVEGLRLNAAGSALLTLATQMRIAGQSGAREGSRQNGDSEKTLKLSISEGIGTFWLIPRLIDYQRLHPDTTVDISCDMGSPDMLLRKADLAIGLERPTQPDLITTKISSIHLMLFASKGYLSDRGTPSHVNAWKDHRFVEQVIDGIPHKALDIFIPAERPLGFITIRANTSTAHYLSILYGAGIGLLPTYIAAVTKEVIALDLGVNMRRDVWLTYHADIRKSPTVQMALKFIKRCFDPKIYPWFSNDFVQPSKFDQLAAEDIF